MIDVVNAFGINNIVLIVYLVELVMYDRYIIYN